MSVRGCPCCRAVHQDFCDCSTIVPEFAICDRHGCTSCGYSGAECECWSCCEEEDDESIVKLEAHQACLRCGNRQLYWREAMAVSPLHRRHVRVTKDGCWIWVGYAADGEPRVWRTPDGSVSARRMVWEAMNNVPLAKSIRLHPCPLDRLCVRPVHQYPKEMLTYDAA